MRGIFRITIVLFLVVVRTISIGEMHVFEAKLFIVIYAIRLAKIFHLYSLWLELDSIYVVIFFEVVMFWCQGF